MTRRLTQLLVVAIAALTAAIAIPTADALILTGNKWPSGRVSVCFRSDAASVPNFAERAKIVKDTVENNWGRVANLQFEGWGICPRPLKSEPQETIVIHWRGQDPTDTGPGTGMSIIGFLSGKPTWMYIDPSPAWQFRALTLHEFGHALGFGHEEDHPSNPTPNRADCLPGKAATSATVLTPFDTNSIMHSRCDGGVLSPLDIVGVQNAYGGKVSGAVVGPNNRCLDIPGSSWAFGVELQVYNCNGTRAQRWEWWKGKLRAMLYRGIFRCADAGDVILPTATVLATQQCYAGSPIPGQRFTFANVQIRGIGEKCVDHGGSVMIMGTVRLADCTGAAGQSWTVEQDGLIRAGSSGNCLDVPFSSFVPGRTLWLYGCNGTPAQRFSFTPLGELRIGGLCVGSMGSLPANGSILQLETCSPGGSGKRNQQFHLTGPIRGLGGKCLDIGGGIAADGAKARLVSCPTRVSAARSWDFYF